MPDGCATSSPRSVRKYASAETGLRIVTLDNVVAILLGYGAAAAALPEELPSGLPGLLVVAAAPGGCRGRPASKGPWNAPAGPRPVAFRGIRAAN